MQTRPADGSCSGTPERGPIPWLRPPAARAVSFVCTGDHALSTHPPTRHPTDRQFPFFSSLLPLFFWKHNDLHISPKVPQMWAFVCLSGWGGCFYPHLPSTVAGGPLTTVTCQYSPLHRGLADLSCSFKLPQQCDAQFAIVALTSCANSTTC